MVFGFLWEKPQTRASSPIDSDKTKPRLLESRKRARFLAGDRRANPRARSTGFVGSPSFFCAYRYIRAPVRIQDRENSNFGSPRVIPRTFPTGLASPISTDEMIPGSEIGRLSITDGPFAEERMGKLPRRERGAISCSCNDSYEIGYHCISKPR